MPSLLGEAEMSFQRNRVGTRRRTGNEYNDDTDARYEYSKTRFGLTHTSVWGSVTDQLPT